MKIRRKTGELTEKIQLNMTPLIDCVFLLLSFFVMTLRFVVPEGDFDIKMPEAGPAGALASDQFLPPIHVKLTAASDGDLRAILVNEQPVSGFAALRSRIMSLVAPHERGPAAAGEGTEAELEFDYGLRYEYVIDAITHVSGYLNADGSTVKLIDRIKFRPPKPPAG